MRIPEDIAQKLAAPPSPEMLQRLARELYEVEPLRIGFDAIPFDSPILSDHAREKCALYAGAIIAAWQRAVLESSAG